MRRIRAAGRRCDERVGAVVIVVVVVVVGRIG